MYISTVSTAYRAPKRLEYTSNRTFRKAAVLVGRGDGGSPAHETAGWVLLSRRCPIGFVERKSLVPDRQSMLAPTPE
jgi:hypothetical protein